MPDPSQITKIEEPWIKSTIITPDEYLGSIIKICQDKKGIQTNLSYSGKEPLFLTIYLSMRLFLILMIGLNPFQVAMQVLIMKFLVIERKPC